MASRDLHNHIEPLVALEAVAITADKVTAGVIIDTEGYEAVEFLIQSDAITDGVYTPEILEGEQANLSDGVAATALIGTVAGATFNGAGDANKVKRLGYMGSHRYVQLNLTSTGVTTGGTLGSIVVLGHPRNQPTA